MEQLNERGPNPLSRLGAVRKNLARRISPHDSLYFWEVQTTVEKWDQLTVRAIEADLRLDVANLTPIQLRSICAPDRVLEVAGNKLQNLGITNLLSLLIGAGGQTPYSNANARIGVGNGDTGSGATAIPDPATGTDTGLTTTQVGGRYFKGMVATYPQVSGTTATFQSVFGGTIANFAWNELAIDNYAVTGGDGTTAPPTSGPQTILNHKAGGANPWLGVKPGGGTWTLTAAITIS